MRRPILAAAIAMLSAGLAAAQPAAPREATITVQGQGRVQVPPDHANLTATVVTKGRSLEAATAAHRDRTQRAASALREMTTDGLQIERSAFHLSEVRVPTPTASQRREETEYQAETTFDLKTKRIDAVDRTITAIAATGLFEVRNLRFGIDEKNPGVNAARRNAVEDARERATTYAQAAGVQLGDIVRIADADARASREFAAAAPMVRGVQVVPPESLTLSASVTITWRIGAKP
jgi:uncharacterized protein YggE